MWGDVGKALVGPVIKSWQFVRRLERDVVKDDGEPAPQRCVVTAGRPWRRRRCSLDAFHAGEHRFD